MNAILIGSEAVSSGVLTRHELTVGYRRLFPDVYLAKRVDATLRHRTVGAWLWSRRRGVIAGAAAAALHGAPHVDADCEIELIWDNGRPPNGLVVRNESLAADEVARIAGLPVTVRERTAFDLGRHLPRKEALMRLDALMWNQRFAGADVLRLAERYPRARGRRQLRELLPLVDGGAASPKESWLRLTVLDGGFPRPVTQYPAGAGREAFAFLDMAWPEYMVALEYDGDQHRTSRGQYVKDIRRITELERIGWIVIRVIAEDSEADILARVRRALIGRGWKP
ncbi:MAG TPA: hypothetical protein PKI77_20495 [Mycobacterium sp.]|nr:hypothetical protein [Mycobacterium sp.]